MNDLLLRRENTIKFSQDGGGIRIMGYVSKKGSLMAMYIIEKLNNRRDASVNFVVGNWDDGSVRSNKQAIFAEYRLDPEPGFIFCNYNEIMKSAYSKVSDNLLNRDEVLESKNLKLYKEILDIIYEEELCSVFGMNHIN